MCSEKLMLAHQFFFVSAIIETINEMSNSISTLLKQDSQPAVGLESTTAEERGIEEVESTTKRSKET